MTRFPRALSTYFEATRPDAPGLPRRRRRDLWRPLLVATVLAAATLVWVRDPALAGRFEGEGTRSVAAGVVATWKGAGEVVGTGRAPTFTWASGSLDLDVEPGAGIALAVHTDEADVRVLGTRFTVARTAYGTDVTVSRGKVSVRCVDGSERVVATGEAAQCAPVSAAGLLRRARALQVDGDPAAALGAVDAALRDPALTAVVQDELLALRVALLTEVGRFDDAVEAARGYLGRPGPVRANAVARLAVDAAADAGTRCGFLAHLTAPRDAERAELAECGTKSGTSGGPADIRVPEGER